MAVPFALRSFAALRVAMVFGWSRARAVLLVALALGSARDSSHAAQQAPSAGTNGFFVFAQGAANGGEELVVAYPATRSLFRFALSGPVARTMNRRGLASPQEAEIAITADAAGLGPIVAVPVQVGPNQHGLDVFDFRAGIPAGPTTISFDGGALPYDVFVEQGAGRLWASESSTNAFGLVTLYRIDVPAAAAPSLGGTLQLAQVPTPFATRIAFDSLTGQLAVPVLNGVDFVDPALTIVVGAAATPQPAPGAERLIVGTNLTANFFGGTPVRNVLCGLRQPAGSVALAAGMLACDGNGANAIVQPIVDAGALPTGLALGLHEVAITNFPSGQSLATLTAFTQQAPGQAFAAGGIVWQIDSALFVTQTQVPFWPIGNPRPSDRVGGGPVCTLAMFAGGINFGLGFMAVGSGGLLPIGALAFQPVSLPNGAPNFTLSAFDGPVQLPGSDTWVVPTKPANPQAQAPFALFDVTSNAIGTLPLITAVGGGNGIGSQKVTRVSVPVGAPGVGLPAPYPAAIPLAFVATDGGRVTDPRRNFIVTSGLLGAPNAQAAFRDRINAAPINGFRFTGTEAFFPGAPFPLQNAAARTPVYSFAAGAGGVPVPYCAVPKSAANGRMVVEFFDLTTRGSGPVFGLRSSLGGLTTEIAAY